jgi:triacylglycerol lipase
MGLVSPQSVAVLAQKIYDVQSGSKLLINQFLKLKEFSQDGSVATYLKAEVGSRLVNTQDGFGMCVRGGKGFEQDIFLIFRGSTKANLGADWISNARIGVETSRTGLPVHIGFNTIFRSMQNQIEEFLAAQVDAVGVVHCIGHSLGGAVATLAADWLSSQGRNVKLYTLGAPKTGLEFFAQRISSKIGSENIYRIYHATDVVPMIPVYPFAHAPYGDMGYQLPSDYLISFVAHKTASYIESIKNHSWRSLAKISTRTIDDRSVERWLKSEKSINPLNAKMWDWINAGLMFVIRKTVGIAAVYLQSPFVGALTLADKIAWLLRKGIDLSVAAGEWVVCLIRKIMQALGMRLAKTAKELTQLFLRRVLQQLLEKMSAEAMRVVRDLVNRN